MQEAGAVRGTFPQEEAMRYAGAAATALLASTMVWAVAHGQGKPEKSSTETGAAIAVIHPTEGNSCRGVVRFTEEGKDIHVVADLQGLPPAAKLGFHVHEFGDCSAADGSSAGGHYNPEGHPHALPPSEPRHAGDLGNVQADSAGVSHYEITLGDISITGKHSVIGHAVVVHAKTDDGSQPTGNAGARIGCGVIGYAKASK